jgi:hypothetical protein
MKSAAANRRAAESAANAAAEPTAEAATIAYAPAIPAVPVAATIAVAAAIAIPISTAEPRADPDEHAAYEVVRPIIAVGRAGIGIITVIAIGASRRPISRITITPHADANRNLRVRGGRSHRERKCKDSEKSQIP